MVNIIPGRTEQFNAGYTKENNIFILIIFKNPLKFNQSVQAVDQSSSFDFILSVTIKSIRNMGGEYSFILRSFK